VATYGELISYRKDDPPEFEELHLERTIPLVIGISGIESMTSKMVHRVREAYNRRPEWYGKILDRMDQLSIQAREAVEEGDLEKRSEEHTSELQSRFDLHSFPTRRSSDLRLSLRNYI